MIHSYVRTNCTTTTTSNKDRRSPFSFFYIMHHIQVAVSFWRRRPAYKRNTRRKSRFYLDLFMNNWKWRCERKKRKSPENETESLLSWQLDGVRDGCWPLYALRIIVVGSLCACVVYIWTGLRCYYIVVRLKVENVRLASSSSDLLLRYCSSAIGSTRSRRPVTELNLRAMRVGPLEGERPSIPIDGQPDRW